MSASLLANELSHLISEAKRKNNELRNAAEKSLQELKSLPSTSEQQIAADLSRRPTFIEPFLIACETRNAKFAGSGVTCLQRLVISKGLPRTRLNEALDAFNACVELGLDIQLKVLQALPSLLQNYAEDLKGDLLAGALQVCASLGGSQVQTVSGVAAATLQQLVTAVFEKVVVEDTQADKIKPSCEIPGDGEPISLRPAAFDAYRVFRDLVLAAEERQTKFVQLPSLSPESGLELIWSSINANPRLFGSHAELGSVIQSNLLPLVTLALSNKLSFPTSVRSLRILDLVLCRYLSKYPGECQVALDMMSQTLDNDNAPGWKRACVMEVIRNMFSSGTLAIEAYMTFDLAEEPKPVLQNLLSTFVHLSAEKPGAIGLGQQSTAPTTLTSRGEQSSEHAVLEATGGMAGVITSALGTTESDIGISTQRSIPRSACLESLDKTDAPAIPETYIYAMVLDCLSSLSDILARIVLPLSVQQEPENASDGNSPDGESKKKRKPRMTRSQSFRKRAVPLNPLELEGTQIARRVHAVADLVDKCWPALLATSSTFLNAALEEHYYRNLIKAYQRFAQVAGLLRLNTPRDALMTTLSKSAVPPHILNSSINEGLRSPGIESPRSVSSPRNLLSVESLVSQASALTSDRERRMSNEPERPMLTTRNLLCLRALLNLAIALGPTLGSAFKVIVDALRQADMILSSISPQKLKRSGTNMSQKESETPAGVQAFTTEVAAVEAAASRLLESTADYPNEPFMDVLNSFCRLLKESGASAASSPMRQTSPSPPATPVRQRTLSGLPGISTFAEMQARDYQFVIPKLGDLAQLNISRFATNDPEESGWVTIVNTLTSIASTSSRPRDARRAATDVICKMSAGIIAETLEEEDDARATVQRRALGVLLQLVDSIYADTDGLTSTDLEIQGHVIDALRSILEHSGESLVAGWNKVIAILSSAFDRSDSESTALDNETRIDWSLVSNDFVSLQVGRVAFAATQLVCSDFLAALPMSAAPSLIELLSRFLQQTDDLNVALTTVSTTWNFSDFLFNNGVAKELDALVLKVKEADSPESVVAAQAQESRSAQTLMLLLRLRDTTGATQKNVRSATFQTICSIFRSHGNELSPIAWDLTLRLIILRIAADDAKLYNQPEQKPEDQETATADEDMSKTIIAGTSEVLAQHIRAIEQVEKLPGLWEIFLKTMELYLDADNLPLSTAVYSALSTILSQLNEGAAIWTTPAYRTIALWLNRFPETDEDNQSKNSNQEAFIAYVDTATELYRLTRESMGGPQLRKIVDNLYYCIEQSDGPKYGGDLNIMSPLQNKVLSFLKDLRTDLPNMPSRLIGVAAQLVVLHHETLVTNSKSHGPTFVALVSESINWLSSLMVSYIKEPEVYETETLVAAIQSLQRLITDKYAVPAEHQGTALWRKATSTALELFPHIVGLIEPTEAPDSVSNAVWAEYVAIASGIVKAHGLPSTHNVTKTHDDQIFDIDSFKKLRNMLIPRLGDHRLPNDVREEYCRALYEASIIHRTEDDINEDETTEPITSPLKDITVSRRGRVKQIPYIERERMCYVCFEELVTLSSARERTPETKKMAQAAAPFLLLRLAVPIRDYIADQPLRGRRPQPYSEFEELLFCFEQIKELELDPDALGATAQMGGKAHVRVLYPLLAKAVAVAGDKWSGSERVLGPLQSVLETIGPVH